MRLLDWKVEPGARIEGSRPLDSSKLQGPGVVALPGGGFRLFYTAVGPAKPFPECQGYILSAVSQDGLNFRPEPGIRVAPRPEAPLMSRRCLVPSLARAKEGGWRMYFESRGPAGTPPVIASAVSSDLLDWKVEEGIRISRPAGVGGPRFLWLPDGRGRIYFFESRYDRPEREGGKRISMSVMSAVTDDGLNFAPEPGVRMRDRQGDYDSVGITAAEVIPPEEPGGEWTMIYSAWQDVTPGTAVPVHPSHDVAGEAKGASRNFAAASIATDMSGFRSRIFAASSPDGLNFGPSRCVLEGAGYGKPGIDAVHAEDMSLVRIGPGRYRMYYAACDAAGAFRIASAISG